MAKRTTPRKEKAAPTVEQLEIKELQRMGKDGRDSMQNARLRSLLEDERRARFSRLYVKRVQRFRDSARRVIAMSNTASYTYTDDEAGQIRAAAKKYSEEIERAFTGSPKEKGLFDL